MEIPIKKGLGKQISLSNKMKLEEKKKKESAEPPYSVQHPWLLICHGDLMQKQTFSSISDHRYYMRNISELKERILLLMWMSGSC